MVHLVLVLAFSLALTFAPLVSGDLRLSSQDDVEDLDFFGIGSPPLRRLMQSACLSAFSMSEGVAVDVASLMVYPACPVSVGHPVLHTLHACVDLRALECIIASS